MSRQSGVLARTRRPVAFRFAAEAFADGATATIEVGGEADGVMAVADFAEAAIEVSTEAAGTPAIADGATASIQVGGDAAGTPAVSDGATATVEVGAEAGGFGDQPQEEDGSTATVSVGAEASFGFGATAMIVVAGRAQVIRWSGPFVGSVRITEEAEVLVR